MDVYFHSDEIRNEALRFNIALATNRAECWQKHTFRSVVTIALIIETSLSTSSELI